MKVLFILLINVVGLDVVVHNCNLCLQEAEAGGLKQEDWRIAV
jgi:hypothetical protein